MWWIYGLAAALAALNTALVLWLLARANDAANPNPPPHGRPRFGPVRPHAHGDRSARPHRRATPQTWIGARSC